MRKKVIKVYAGILIAGLLYTAWILLTDIKIPCFFLETLGIMCPGCGVTRMFLSMLKLDFAAAFKHNPVVFILFWIWNIIGVVCIFGKTEFVKKEKFMYTALGITIGVMVIFGAVRNFV